MVELKEFNVFDYLTTMEDYKEYIKVLHQEMEKMEYERQPLPEWSTLLAEKDKEIKRLRAALEMFACDCAVHERCAVPDNCRNFQARRAALEEPRT